MIYYLIKVIVKLVLKYLDCERNVELFVDCHADQSAISLSQYGPVLYKRVDNYEIYNTSNSCGMIDIIRSPVYRFRLPSLSSLRLRAGILIPSLVLRIYEEVRVRIHNQFSYISIDVVSVGISVGVSCS